MKKYLAVLLTAALFAMTLGGCGGRTNSQDGNISEETASTAKQETAGTTDSEDEAPTDIFVPYYGTWEVKDYQSAEVSAIGAEEMESFRGATVTYQSDSILLNGEDVNTGSFTYEKGDTPYNYDKLTEDYQANLGEWWNNISEVTEVTVTSDTDFFGSHLFIADEDTLWIYYEGVFFLAKK